MKVSGGPRTKLNCRTLRAVRNRYQDWSDLYQSTPSKPQSKRLRVPSPANQSAYQVYLTSEHWRETRAQALARAKYKCEQCGLKQPPLNVHHLSYRSLGHEHPLDLIVLCPNCHAIAHGLPVESIGPVTRSGYPAGHVEAMGTRVVCGSGPSSNTSQDSSATPACWLAE